jgi:DNA invertase Pin-like site-specific DNA recombinase
MRVGYAKVSRRTQRLKPQRDPLLADGCERDFEEKVFSGKSGRKALREALNYCHEGHDLVVTRLDRLARSFREFIAANSAAEAAPIYEKLVEDGFRGRFTVARG